jgi:hypothetical protein
MRVMSLRRLQLLPFDGPAGCSEDLATAVLSTPRLRPLHSWLHRGHWHRAGIIEPSPAPCSTGFADADLHGSMPEQRRSVCSSISNCSRKTLTQPGSKREILTFTRFCCSKPRLKASRSWNLLSFLLPLR